MAAGIAMLLHVMLLQTAMAIQEVPFFSNCNCSLATEDHRWLKKTSNPASHPMLPLFQNHCNSV